MLKSNWDYYLLFKVILVLLRVFLKKHPYNIITILKKSEK